MLVPSTMRVLSFEPQARRLRRLRTLEHTLARRHVDHLHGATGGCGDEKREAPAARRPGRTRVAPDRLLSGRRRRRLSGDDDLDLVVGLREREHAARPRCGKRLGIRRPRGVAQTAGREQFLHHFVLDHPDARLTRRPGGGAAAGERGLTGFRRTRAIDAGDDARASPSKLTIAPANGGSFGASISVFGAAGGVCAPGGAGIEIRTNNSRGVGGMMSGIWLQAAGYGLRG